MGTTAKLSLQIFEDQREQRVLILAPSGTDAEVLSRTLDDAAIGTTVCSTLEELCREMDNGAAAAILAEEILTANSGQMLAEALSHQPEWSDFPLIVMGLGGGRHDSSSQWLAGIKAATHIVLLERPVRKKTLLSSARAALQARTRQYQVRAELLRRRQAEEALRQTAQNLLDSQAQLAAETAALVRLNDVSTRLWRMGSLHEGLDEMLSAAVDLLGADMGNAQILDANHGVLLIAAQRGFGQDFLDFFREVTAEDDSVCGRALSTGERLVVEDVETDELFAPLRSIARAAGFRAVQSTPLLSRDGTPLGMLSTHCRSPHRPSDQEFRLLDLYARQASDFIERFRIDEALHKSQERYELIVAGTGAAIWDWDVLGKRVVYSPRWKELRGLSDAGVSDRIEEWSSRIHLDDVDRVMDSMRAHFEGRTQVFSEEYRVRHEEGQWIWIMDRGLAKRDDAGNVIRVAGSQTDITARKVAEEALRESEERFRTLADSSPVLIWVNGLEGCEFVNRAYLDYLGTKPTDVEKFNWGEFIHPEDRDSYVNAYLTNFAKREFFTKQFRFRRFDGEYRWMKAVGLPRFSGTGEFQGYVGSTLDITDIKEAEAALRESDRRKDEFLAMLGHELRNPLAAISSGTTLLQSGPSPERRVWIEEMIVRQVGQLQRLVDDLLDVARITRGKIELRKAHLPLRDLLEGCVGAVEDLINQRCHQVSMSIPAQELYVEADRTRLEQMVVNLLTNAAKYTPEGGRIWLSAEQSDQEVIIRCRDTGVGLSPDTLGAIFEPFAQFDTSAERTSGGLGMGLALVKTLAEMHGGSVTASSDGLGKGSEFLLRVPAATGAPRAVSTAKASPANEPRQPLKILVVDDNRDLAESLALFLRNAGHQVSVAHDGETAIARALEERPEVVLLDIGLPGIDGFAVAERLRASADLNQTMIIAVSGWKVQEKAEAARIRFDAQLVKPVDHEQLAVLLQARTTHRYGD